MRCRTSLPSCSRNNCPAHDVVWKSMKKKSKTKKTLNRKKDKQREVLSKAWTFHSGQNSNILKFFFFSGNEDSTIFIFSMKSKFIKRVSLEKQDEIFLKQHKVFSSAAMLQDPLTVWGADFQRLQPPGHSPGKTLGPFWSGGCPRPALPPPRTVPPTPSPRVLSAFAPLVLWAGIRFHQKRRQITQSSGGFRKG